MGITEFALNRTRMAVVLVAGILLGGAFTFLNYPSSEDPTITIRGAQVTARYPGMSARRVEDLITRKLEERIREIPEVKTIKSTSKAGVSIITVELYDRYFDLKPIWQNLRNKMTNVRSELPEGTTGPDVNDDYGLVAVATLMLTKTPGFTNAEWRRTARDLRIQLNAVRGVKKVELTGTPQERVFLEFKSSRLAQYGLNPADLVQTLQRQNIIRPGGTITSRGTEILVEPTGAYTSLPDIGSTVIYLPKSKQVAYLRDVAVVRRATVDPPNQLAYFNGKPAIVIAISMIEGGNIVAFGERLRRRVSILQGGLPWGYVLHTATFQPARVASAIADFSSNLYQTIAIVLVVVMVFLGFRTGLIVGAAVPLTMLMAVIVMRLSGVELQRMSIAALIISLGMLVDNGIVIAEDIKRRLEAGIDRREACVEAGRVLAVPLLTSSLTTILAFSPLLLADNVTGEYMRSLATVVLITLLCSWFLAMFSTPLFAYLFVRVKPRAAGATEDAAYDGAFYQVYRRLLATVLRFKYQFIGVVVVTFVGTLMLFPLIPVEFMPPSDRNQIQINIDLPAGASSHQTDKVVREFSAWLKDKKQNPEVTLSAMYVGYGGPRFFLALSPIDPDGNRAYALINTKSKKDLPVVMARFRRYFLEQQPNVRAAVKDLFLGAKEPGTVEYRVVGPDAQVLRDASEKLKAGLRKIGGLAVLQDDWENRTLTLIVKVDQSKARRAGVTSTEIANALNFLFSGDRVTDYREADNIIPVILRGDAKLRFTLDRMLSVSVFSATSGKAVPLLQIASLDGRWDDSRIRRRDLQRTLTLTARHTTLLATNLHAGMVPTLESVRRSLPAGYRIELGGELESAGEANSALLGNMPIALAAIFVLLIWQFNSLRRTAIIGLTIPLSLIGAILGLLIMQSKFGFTSLLGILSLAGIIINNAIVLIDRIEIERQAGATIRDAILSAGVKRLRPILITTMTTILGLIPLMLFGGDLWYGMAVVIMFGLGVGTILTLGVVPALYAIFFGARRPNGEERDEVPPEPSPRVPSGQEA